MKQIQIPLEAYKFLLEQFATEVLKKPVIERVDFAEIDRQISPDFIGDERLKVNNELFPFNNRKVNKWLYNTYGCIEEDIKLEKTSRPVQINFLESILKYLSYRDLDDFLKKNGFGTSENPEIVKKIDVAYIESKNEKYSSSYYDFLYKMGARFLPSAIALFCLPVFSYTLIFDNHEQYQSISFLIPVVYILLVIAQHGWIATLGKKYEENFFQKRNGFPSEYLMLYSHESDYTDEDKDDYRKRIESCFDNLRLKGKQEELEDVKSALRLLRKAYLKIKIPVKGVTIISANTKYGQTRNLIPATLILCALSFLTSISGLLMNSFLTYTIQIGIFLLAISWHLYLRKGDLLKRTAEAYATYLINEFLGR